MCYWGRGSSQWFTRSSCTNKCWELINLLMKVGSLWCLLSIYGIQTTWVTSPHYKLAVESMGLHMREVARSGGRGWKWSESKVIQRLGNLKCKVILRHAHNRVTYTDFLSDFPPVKVFSSICHGISHLVLLHPPVTHPSSVILSPPLFLPSTANSSLIPIVYSHIYFKSVYLSSPSTMRSLSWTT